MLLSTAIALQLPEPIRVDCTVLRYAVLGLTSVVCLVFLRLIHLSAQAIAWCISAIYASATVLYTIDVPATVLRAATFGALVFGVFLGAAICHSSPTARPSRLLETMSVLTAALALLAVAAWALGMPSSFLQGGGYVRGYFLHSNSLGAFGAMWTTIAVGLADQSPSRFRRVAVVAALAMLTALLGSRSRAGLGAAVTGIALYVLVTRSLHRLLSAAIIIATLAVLTVTTISAIGTETRDRTKEFVYKGQSRDLFFSRRENLETGWNNFMSSPWIGYGFGTSPGQVSMGWRVVGLGGREKGNAIIAVLEETGVIGSVFLCLPIVFIVAQGLRYRACAFRMRLRMAGCLPEVRVGAALWAATMAGLANNMAEASLWSPGAPFGGMILFLAGAADGTLRRFEREQ